MFARNGSSIQNGISVLFPRIQYIAKCWSLFGTSIPTLNQSSSPQQLAALTPDTVQSIYARKTLTTTPPKFKQRLNTARVKLAKQRRSSVQDFCLGLADPSVHEFASSGAKHWLSVLREAVNFAGAKENWTSPLAIFCAAQNYRSGRGGLNNG